VSRVLVVAHDHVSFAAAVGEAFADRGFTLDEELVVPADRFESPGVHFAFPDPTAYDALVVLGAPWAAYDDLVSAWVRPELDMLRAADAAGVPVLGICFGGQLLALAHGGDVAVSPAPEIGWHVVHSDDPSLVPEGPWFQWHYDRWTLPPGATEVARNAAASQAFVLRRNLAVQFHPELGLASLKAWLAHGGDDKARARGLDPDVLLAHTEAIQDQAAERARRLVDAFLERV
jgi:GMP synthase-like glutamine amidotransferase